MSELVIRVANKQDWEQIWPIFHAVVAAGETYVWPHDLDYSEGLQLWIEQPQQTFIAQRDDEIVGTYYIKSNQSAQGQRTYGPGAHVCNCGYMVAPAGRRSGVATAMCEHSLAQARLLGYQAMQFNSVVASNTGAVKLWQQMGFAIVGTVPKAFLHPKLGYVDTLVMYRWLTESA